LEFFSIASACSRASSSFSSFSILWW
jgi:hypothetical protein